MIISGGENVYPSEVEKLLGTHPAVQDVAVIGIPHDKWGEAVHAVVVLHAGLAVTEDEILDWCKDRIAGYKRPRAISFIAESEMPRTATGKIQHRILRDRVAGTRKPWLLDDGIRAARHALPALCMARVARLRADRAHVRMAVLASRQPRASAARGAGLGAGRNVRRALAALRDGLRHGLFGMGARGNRAQTARFGVRAPAPAANHQSGPFAAPDAWVVAFHRRLDTRRPGRAAHPHGRVALDRAEGRRDAADIGLDSAVKPAREPRDLQR